MINVRPPRPGFNFLLITILFVWAGMLLGISFLEAPLKFQAPGITLALGLSIGRLVFSTLNKIEILFASVLIITAFTISIYSRLWYFFTVILAILILQTFWLLPALDARAETIIQGGIPEASSLHILYIVLEFLKLLLLITLGLRTYSESLKSMEKSYGRYS